ncbi:hypothetical protein V8E52_006077 [Russula decolorans]
MMRQKHANWELDTQSAFVHEVVFAHSRIVCSQFIYFDLLPPCEANLETPRAQKANPNVVTNGKRKRVASAKQGSIDDDANEKRLARLARLEKENKKMKVKLLKASKEAAKNKACLEDSDDSDNSLESEDAPEVDQPVRFSSLIKSLGVVDGTPPKKLRKQAIGQSQASQRGRTGSPASSYRTHTSSCDDGDDTAPRGREHGRMGSPASSSPYRTHTLSCDDGDDTAPHGWKRGRTGSPTSSYRTYASSCDDGDNTTRAPRGRKHGRIRTGSPTSSYRTRTSPPVSPSSPDQKRFKTPQIHAGVLLSSKPKASDYEDVVKRRLLEAMSIYETYIFTDRAYPTQELQFKRIKEAWGFASADAEEQYELTNRMLRLVKDRGPRARGFLKDITRPHIKKAFGFTPSTNKKVVQKNVDRYLELMEGRIFHYKDPATKTGFAENAIIKKVLREAFFRRKDDRGITHANSFSPIPLALIALILTAVEHCIEEWSTGTLVKANFEESTAAPLYDTHLEKLRNWHELNPTVVDKILETLFKRCSRPLSAATGGDLIPAMTDAVKEAARKELEARTGETESDSDA